MKKVLSVFILLLFILCSCTPKIHEESISQDLYVSDSNTSIISGVSEQDDASLCSENTSTPDDTNNIELDIEINDDMFAVIFGATLESELPMSAQFGKNIYVSQYVDGVLGTMRICNGTETVFFPNVSNIYEKDGAAYGILSEGESYMELIRYYCRLNEDGTSEKLFKCWNAFYSDDKVYFYEYTPAETENDSFIVNVCSANIDGSDKKVISADIPTPYFTDRIIRYKDYLIYTANYDDIYVISADGTVFKAVDGSDASYEIEFVNNGFIYYSKKVVSKGSEINNEEIPNYSLWRVKLNGGNQEQIVGVQTDSYSFDAAPFSGKLILIYSEGVRVYSDSISNCCTYEYENFTFDEIVQISVCGDVMFVVGSNNDPDNASILKTIAYDAFGNIIFDNR